jgi:hypothetical protein
MTQRNRTGVEANLIKYVFLDLSMTRKLVSATLLSELPMQLASGRVETAVANAARRRSIVGSFSLPGLEGR